MANINNLSLFLKDIASSIRNKKGTSDLIPAANFDTEIASIETGVDTSDANAVPDDITMNKTAYVNGEKITGNLPLFPDSRTYTADGYVTNDTENSKIKLSTMNATKQILDSNVNIEMSADYSDMTTAIGLSADKIKKDETILGVTGTVEEGANINDYFVTNVSESVTGPTGSKSAVCLITKLPPLDLSGVTNMTRFFENFRGLEELPEMDTSDVTNMYGLCMSCKSLTTITHLDTSSATNMTYMFDYSGIVTLPQLNLQNVTSMSGIFRGCSSLSNESLNNILASLITATLYTGTKTLEYLGLNQTQATTCTTLSNWAACEAAGWTTGY